MDKDCDNLLIVKAAKQSFMIRFFGIGDLIESYEKNRLLVTYTFKQMLKNKDEDVDIEFYFILQEIDSILGIASYNRIDDMNLDEQDNTSDLVEILINWKKLMIFDCSKIPNILDFLKEEEDWEVKKIPAELVNLLEKDLDSIEEISLNNLELHYEEVMKSNEEKYHHKTSGTTSPENISKRSRSQSSTDSKTMKKEEIQPKKKSRIPFDVTNMNYEQYCAKHYSYAIDLYRKEKAMLQASNLIPQQQQQSMNHPYMMPMMPMMMGHTGIPMSAGLNMAGPMGGSGMGMPIGMNMIGSNMNHHPSMMMMNPNMNMGGMSMMGPAATNRGSFNPQTGTWQ